MIIFVIDHLFKNIIKDGCFLFICLKYATNTGAAFSLLAGIPWTGFLLIAIALIVLAIVGYFYFKYKEKKLLRVSLALIFAGTLSNTLDRIFLGYVIDNFTLSFWPTFTVFNLADVTNLVGVILLITYLLKKK